MKILDTMKKLVRSSTIAMVATVAMTTTTMVATHDAYAFPNLSFGRIAELSHYQSQHGLGLGLTVGGLSIGPIIAGGLLVAAFPEAAVVAAGIGVVVAGVGAYNLWKAKHDVGSISGEDRWFLDLNVHQRHQFFPDYYHPGASVSRNADTRGGRAGSLAPSSTGGANMGMHH